MALFDAKSWFITNITAVLAKFKLNYNDIVDAKILIAKTDLLAEIGSIGGTIRGSSTTFAGLPTSGVKTNDLAVLLVDDGAYESGLYVKNTGGWVYLMDIATFNEVQLLLATDAEFVAGLTTQKAATVKQVVDSIANAISAINLSLGGKAAIDGSITQAFSVADAEAGTKQAVNASQFGTAITQAEAQAIWDAL